MRADETSWSSPIGRSFDFDMGALKVNLAFVSDSEATYTIVDGGGMAEDGHSETVTIEIARIREGLYLTSWTEAGGATVTHLEDYAEATVHSHATIAGTLYRFTGTITEV